MSPIGHRRHLSPGARIFIAWADFLPSPYIMDNQLISSFTPCMPRTLLSPGNSLQHEQRARCSVQRYKLIEERIALCKRVIRVVSMLVLTLVCLSVSTSWPRCSFMVPSRLPGAVSP